MTFALNHLSAISLFVEDLQDAKTFYQNVFGAQVIFADEASVALRFDNVIINLLRVENALEIIEPGMVASRQSGSRFQLSVWVADVDAVCAELLKRGVAPLSGPRDRAWGMRTANFVDPAGHSWEIAHKLPALTKPRIET